MTLAARLAEPDVASLDDAQAAAALNAPDVANGTKRVDVSVRDARGILLLTGEWGAVKLLARTEPSEQVPAQIVAAAIVAADTLDPSQTGVIEASKPGTYTATQTLLGALVQAGVLSQNTVDALLALCDRPKSWAEANGYPNGVTVDDVFAARGRPRIVEQQ